MAKELEFDGERFTPEGVREIWYEHMHRYAFASRLVGGLDVLDAACGEGYGSAMLADFAQSVTGADVSGKAIDHASGRYAKPNLAFQQADCCALPFQDDQFDCVISFETIEHLENQAGMLGEFRRVLKPGGFALISSPDKAVYSDAQGFDNPHHVRELYRDEFQALLDGYFPATRMLGQKLMFHSAIWPMDSGSADRMSAAQLQSLDESGIRNTNTPVQDAMYLLALCAQERGSLPSLENALWLFDDPGESVYRHYNEEVRKHIRAGELLAERDREIEQLKNALDEAQNARPRSVLERLGLSKRR